MENFPKSEKKGNSRWQVQRERGQIVYDHPNPPSTDPKHISNVMEGILDALDRKDGDWMNKLGTQWDTIAGETVARHTRPGIIEAQCLTVFVDNSVWLNELSRYGKSQLLRNIHAQLGDDRVMSLRLRLDPCDDQSLS